MEILHPQGILTELLALHRVMEIQLLPGAQMGSRVLRQLMAILQVPE
jgi:hypothetical protein